MLELKLPRLLAAAKEFNVGQDTIVDFLVAKGFNRDDLKPTAKLSEEMYRSLQHQFQGDKVAKNKADLVEIPKGVQQEARKKRDEEEITFIKKEFAKPAAPAPEPTPAPTPQPVPEPKIQEPVAEAAPAPQVHEAQKPLDQPQIEEPKQPEPQLQAEPSVEELPPVQVIQQENAVTASDNNSIDTATSKPVFDHQKDVEDPNKEQLQENVVPLKIEAPEIEGPKVIAKIDLSAIDSSTRPKKGF